MLLPSTTKPVTFIVIVRKYFLERDVNILSRKFYMMLVEITNSSPVYGSTWPGFNFFVLYSLNFKLHIHIILLSTLIIHYKRRIHLSVSVVCSEVCVWLVTMGCPWWGRLTTVTTVTRDGRGRGDPGDQAVWNMKLSKEKFMSRSEREILLENKDDERKRLKN